MPRLADIEGFLSSECPHEWASDNLTLVAGGDSGEHARVYAHPTDPSLVVRVSDYPDGWFLHGHDYLTMLEEEETPSVHMPKVLEIAEAGDCFVALAARLSNIEEGSEMEAAANAAVALIRRDTPGDGDAKALETLAPGFMEFVETLRKSAPDTRDGNILTDGRTLVFNDPYGTIPFSMEGFLRETYAVRPPPDAAPGRLRP